MCWGKWTNPSNLPGLSINKVAIHHISNLESIFFYLVFVLVWFFLVFKLHKSLNPLEVKPGLVLLPPNSSLSFLQQQSQISSGLPMQNYQKADFACADMKPAAALAAEAIRSAGTARAQGRESLSSPRLSSPRLASPRLASPSHCCQCWEGVWIQLSRMALVGWAQTSPRDCNELFGKAAWRFNEQPSFHASQYIKDKDCVCSFFHLLKAE